MNIYNELKDDVLLFGRICLPRTFYLPSPKLHKEWAEVYEDKTKQKVCIIAPRGHAKSSFFACLCVLHHVFFDEGSKFIVLVSKTEGHAIGLLDTIKDALDFSLPLRRVVGYWGRHSAERWQRSEVILKDGTKIACRGTGQQVVGLKHINQRPTLIILDDPEDMNNTKTDESMEFNLKWFLNQLMPMRDAQRGRVFVIGTPQHQRCMVEKLMVSTGWHSKRYKALNDDGPRKDWTALWPQLWPVEKLVQEKEELESINRVSSFYREYQCMVISDATALFKEEYIQTYDGSIFWQDDGAILKLTGRNGKELQTPEYIPVTIFMGVDLAFSTREGADYTVIMPVAHDAKRNWYVLEYIRKRMPPSETIEKIKSQLKYWKPNRIAIETTAGQDTIRDILHKDDEMYFVGLGEKNSPRERKDKRYLEVLEPWFQRRKVFLKTGMDELKNELVTFGPAAQHDDMLDALYWAMKRGYPPTHDFVVKREHVELDTVYRRDGWLSV